MSEINFVEVDAGQIQQETIQEFQTALNEIFKPSDERLLFLQQETPIIVALKNNINDSARQNLLRYARDEVLDALGEFYGDRGERLSAQTATVTLRITLSATQPADYVISKDDIMVTPDGTLDFISDVDATVLAGQLTVDIQGKAAAVGAIYNGFTVGQIKGMVKSIPYVASITNTDTSSGGADIEDDDSYRARLQLLPEAFSVAGPEGAYIFWAKSVDSTIVDVKVDSPSPGVVRVVPLLKDGGIPDEDLLNKVLAAISPKDRRPLTDNPQVAAPTEVDYDITFTYYLKQDLQTDETKYRQAIEGENLDSGSGSAVATYIAWQQGALGQTINPDMLRFFLQSSCQYQVNGTTQTAIKRITLTEPAYETIDSIEVAKVDTITVTYGGLE